MRVLRGVPNPPYFHALSIFRALNRPLDVGNMLNLIPHAKLETAARPARRAHGALFARRERYRAALERRPSPGYPLIFGRGIDRARFQREWSAGTASIHAANIAAVSGANRAHAGRIELTSRGYPH